MKINIESVRAILLCLEDNLIITDEGQIQEVTIENISEWERIPQGEVANILMVLEDAGFIILDYDEGDNELFDFTVSRITFKGYEFLESIRNQDVFSKVKNFLSKHGLQSIEIVGQLAGGVISSMIADYIKYQ